MKAVLALSFLGLVVLAASGPGVTAEERAKVLRLLRESEKEFLELIGDVSEAGWRFKPGADRWSVAEVAEHIVLAEGALFGMAQKALAAGPNPDWEARTAGKTEFLDQVMVDRSRRAQAPESVAPKGALSRQEAVSRYGEARARTRKFIEETALPLKAHTADHPFKVFGTLNAYQWALYIPLHNMRHNQQIAEVKASTGFPR